MDTKEINVHVAEGVKTLEILHGDAMSRPDPNVLLVKTLIGGPFEFLSKQMAFYEDKGDAKDELLNDSVLLVDRDKRTIELQYGFGNPYGDNVKGRLIMNPDFEKFQINTGESRSTFGLSDFIKMNRSFFPEKNDALKLVSDLRNFKAKVDNELENADDQRGNKKVKLYQTVESNIPKAFPIKVPIFKGDDPVTISVEINIDANSFECTLISPEAREYIIEARDAMIDEQLEKFEQEFPELAILEV